LAVISDGSGTVDHTGAACGGCLLRHRHATGGLL